MKRYISKEISLSILWVGVGSSATSNIIAFIYDLPTISEIGIWYSLIIIIWGLYNIRLLSSEKNEHS